MAQVPLSFIIDQSDFFVQDTGNPNRDTVGCLFPEIVGCGEFERVELF
jgi:hypothetical protein